MNLSGECEPVYKDGVFWIYLLLVIGTVFVQNFFMKDEIQSDWYKNLNQPSFVPPSYFFTIIWTIIYFLLAWSTFMGQQSAQAQGQSGAIINVAFALNLVLSVAWAWVFFQQKNPQLAFWIILILLVETIWLAYLVYSVNKVAGSLFLIYIFWLAIAATYNWQIISLNKNNLNNNNRSGRILERMRNQ